MRLGVTSPAHFFSHRHFPRFLVVLKDSSDVSLITADDGALAPRSPRLLLPQPGTFCRCCSLKTAAENWEKTVSPSELYLVEDAPSLFQPLIPAHGARSELCPCKPASF